MKNVRLIALDMDGTLLKSDHRTISERNIEAIRRADRAGIRVCICTGRMLEDASEFIHRLKLPCSVIAGNGTRVSDGPLPEGKILLRRRFFPQDAHRVTDLLLPYGLTINALEDGRVSTYSPDGMQSYHLVRRGVVKGCYGEAAIRSAAERGVMKFYVAADSSSGSKADARIQKARAELRRELPHLQITSSAPGNLEIMPAGANKGTALAYMAQQLGLSSQEVMAMGDAQNDLSMLRYAYHSVAMANACGEVKAVCRYQTLSNDACGVAAMIERVLEEREDAAG